MGREAGAVMRTGMGTPRGARLDKPVTHANVSDDPAVKAARETEDEVLGLMEAMSSDSEDNYVPLGDPEEGERVYHSRILRYRLQITTPADNFEHTTGKKVVGVPVFAQFEQISKTMSEYRIDRSHPQYDLITTAMDKAKNFGVLFWDAEKLRRETTQAAEDKAMELILKSPRMAARVQAKLQVMLGQKDFKPAGPSAPVNPPQNPPAVPPAK